MNIEQAKTQIKNATIAYFTKNSHGEYKIPIERQRPVFLVGPPGIGKTAIMEQIAAELNVGLVSYSMTHHTRQSAIGLPFITKKIYNGKEYSVSEYTMSEIIASIYDYMERTGKREGILFLDEINCVSETLAPAMLQFLQYKVFGNHSLPEGWIVVTAGNPPEFNKSVHEFDLVTWDRLKRIEVEADYDTWRNYAVAKHMHPAVIAYLDAKNSKDVTGTNKFFYRVQNTINGRELITARGWEDVSQMLQIYEQDGIKADYDLIRQYIHCNEVARDFAVYYEIYSNYKTQFELDNVMDGNITTSMLNKASHASLDERIAITNILTEQLVVKANDFADTYNGVQLFTSVMKPVIAALQTASPDNALEILHNSQQDLVDRLEKAKKSEADTENIHAYKYALEQLKECIDRIRENPSNSMGVIRAFFQDIGSSLKMQTASLDDGMTNIYTFLENSFGEGAEIVLLSTAITNDTALAKLIAQTNNAKYMQYVNSLKLTDRRAEILADLQGLSTEHTDIFN